MRKLRIAYLLEESIEAWGGVQMVFREADALTELGHELCIYSKTEAPSWHRPRCRFVTVPDFDPRFLEIHDLVIGTYFPTVLPALLSACGRPVHYCQGYEGDSPQMAEALFFIESVYQLEGLSHVTISPFLAERLQDRFGLSPRIVPYGVRDDLYRPLPTPREVSGRLRVAVVGPWEVSWKDIPTGVHAARIAHERGLAIELVRVSPTPCTAAERKAYGDLPVEWHEKLDQQEMPELYRSCDLFLGTSNGGAEGFFLPAMEAMACGLPVVLSDIACFRQYRSPADYCSFIAPGDAEGFAAEITRLSESKEERLRLRTLSLEVAELHTFTRHLEAIAEVYQELVPRGAALSEGASPYDPRQELPEGDFDRIAMVQRLLAHAGAPGVEFEQAKDAIGCALKLDPASAAAWNKLARVHCNENDTRAALDALHEGRRVDTKSPTLARLEGLVHFERGEYEDAAQALERACEYLHSGASVRLELSIALLKSGRIAQAEERWREAIEIGSYDERAHQLHAQIQTAFGLRPQAVDQTS